MKIVNEYQVIQFTNQILFKTQSELNIIKTSAIFFMKFNQFDQIQSTITLIRANCKLIAPHYKSIIFTGQTGSGKGTLIHYLLKNQNLYAKLSQQGQMIIDTLQNKSELLNQIKISQKMSSETSIPKSIQHKGEVFRDFPGFHDNRQDNSMIVQDIINQFYIAEVYKKTKQIKIVYVISRSTLNDRAQQFIHSVRSFVRQFQQINSIANSICLVITKAQKQIQVKHIKASIKKILEQLKDDLLQNQLILLNYFESTQHIIIFHVPQKQGKIDFGQSDKINRIIKNLKFSKSPAIKIHFDNHSQIKMKNLLLKWNEYIQQICETYMLLQTHSFFQLYRKFQDVQRNQKSLINFGTYLDLLISSQNQHVFLKIFTQTPVCFSEREIHRIIRSQIEKFIKFISFFSFLGNQAYDIQKWKSGPRKLLSSLNCFLQQPLAQRHGKSLYLKGFYCDSTMIQKNIDKQMGQKVHNLIIFSFVLNLNNDIDNQGKNLIVLTQNINIPKSIQINLRGKSGQDYQQQSAFNKNGLPGKPGLNGGNLIVRTFHHTIEQHKLKLDLRGGQGGKGQNGGKIMVEPNEQWINKIQQDIKKNQNQKNLLICRQTYKFSDKKFLSKFGHVLRVLGTYNDQILQKYSTQKVKQKFFQTYGGCHGMDGKCGIVDIGKIDFKLILKDQKTLEPSFGYKETYEGIYVKEMIFPNLREAGKQILGCRRKSQPKKQQQQKISRLRRNSINSQKSSFMMGHSTAIHSQNEHFENNDFSNSLMQTLQMQILESLLTQTKIQIQEEQRGQQSDIHEKNKSSQKKQSVHQQIHESNPEIIKQNKKTQINQKKLQFFNGAQIKKLIKQKTKQNVKIIKNSKQKDQFVVMISKQLLQQFGKQVATEVGTDVITGVGKNIIKNVGAQTLKTTTKQFGKQFITKGTSTLGAEFIKAEIGKQTIKGIGTTITSESFKQLGNVARLESIKQIQKAATIQAAKSSIQGGSYIVQTALGISKSMFLQAIVSAVMASGISDGWLVQPHLVSKKVQNGCATIPKKIQGSHSPYISHTSHTVEPIKPEQMQQLKQDFLTYIAEFKNYFTSLSKSELAIKKV